MEIIQWIDSRNLPSSLINAQSIKEWVEKYGKKPSAASKDMQERKLGMALSDIRRNWIKVYNELETKEEKQKFRIKHPKIDEIEEIISWIDENNVSTNLLNARNIKKWMQDMQTTKPPTAKSKDNKESKLGRALINIKTKLFKPYIALKTEEERKKFKEENPEIQEIVDIMLWIDENNVSTYLKNARAIKAWVEKHDSQRLPRRLKDKDCVENELGKKLSNIRQDLIKPYMSIQTEEERKKFIERNPDTEKVIEIITTLDMQCGNTKQKELANMIREVLKKREIIREAKQLEADYEKQLKR